MSCFVIRAHSHLFIVIKRKKVVADVADEISCYQIIAASMTYFEVIYEGIQV